MGETWVREHQRLNVRASPVAEVAPQHRKKDGTSGAHV